MADDQSRITEYVEDKTVSQGFSPTVEFGHTGLKRNAGFVDEEFLPALRGRKAIQVFAEMAANDATIGAMLYTFTQLLRQVKWTVVAEEQTPEQEAAVQFLEECMQDMSHSWDDMIAEILSMLTYGWSWFEVVYKKRVGPWEPDARRRSRYTDGKFGWRKIAIRSQDSFFRWVFDDDGGIQAMVQMSPPHYKQVAIPISKSLLFRFGAHKNNPEGYSLLRNAYRSWFMKKRLEEHEAIGIERDLAGMPVGRIPARIMESKNPKEQQMFQAMKKMVKNAKRDEHDGFVIPSDVDPETKQPLYQFELMSSGGGRSIDTNAVIQRYETAMLMSTLTDFIKLGQTSTGSYAMHVDKTGIFRASLNAIAEAIADVFNRHAIPKLFEMNQMKLDRLPKLKPTNVDPPNLGELSSFMQTMSGLGMQWFPDPDLEKFLRDIAHLPEMGEDQEEMQRIMAMDQQASQFMEGRTATQSAQKKQELIDQGYTPEQAEQATQQPNADMHAGEMTSQAEGQMAARENPAVQAQEAEEQQMMQQEKDEELERTQMEWDREDQHRQEDQSREDEKVGLTRTEDRKKAIFEAATRRREQKDAHQRGLQTEQVKARLNARKDTPKPVKRDPRRR